MLSTCELWYSTMLSWKTIESFTSCQDAKTNGNMYFGFYNGIVRECYNHQVVQHMSNYLWTLQATVNNYANCNWYDCTTSCFNNKDVLSKAVTTQCASALDITTIPTVCDDIVKGYYAAELY